METVGASRKKKILTVVIVVLIIVLAGGAGLGLRWWQDRDDNKGNSSDQGESGFSSTIDEIQSLGTAGDVDAAKAKIDQALQDSNLSSKEKYNLYIQQGNTAASKQDYTAAIASYQRAEAIDKTYEITLLLADTWAAAGDKAKAIQYYKKALPIVPDTPAQEDTKELIEQLIKNLEAES